MKTLFIDRQVSDIALGTLSIASFSHVPDTFHYLEPPWMDNVPNKSCVPPGIYAGVWERSQRFGMVYHLIGNGICLRAADLLPKRGITRWGCIAGHAANLHQQLQGCGAFGLSSKRNHAGNGKGRSHYVGRSVPALRQVHAILEQDPVIQVVIGSDL